MSLSKYLMLALRLSRNLGVRALLMTLLALVSVFVAPLFDWLISDALKERFGQEAVLPVLTILASSMLTVTTFSLGVMVQAFQSASSQATPRAYRILMQDGTTQTVLATFVGAFLFSLTAIVMFRADIYDDAASVVIFFFTLFVIAAIILAILRWIGHLSRLGSMDHTLNLVEKAAQPPLRALSTHPALGGVPSAQAERPPPRTFPVTAPHSGYLQFVDMPSLNDLLSEAEARLWLMAPPGHYVIKGDTIAELNIAGDDLARKAQPMFTIGKTRSLEQDARFGLMVLAEIATRALSPGINDPGTAIDVIHRLMNLLQSCPGPSEEPPQFSRIIAPQVAADDLVQDAFDTIARDGAGRIEVVTQLRHALDRLEECDWPAMAEAARAHRHYALDQADVHIPAEADRDALNLSSRD
ncbi:DUF2254 domain-containing protein [Primorskyibacter sp. 2E107]|uniref:DUF2254 domain-containing protein n=1 Tax=Primorskyibacter sp. 2E107 TaxID=3403458 RepID=UPI003AF5CC65